MVCLVVFPVNGCTCAGDNGMPCVISWCKDMVLESLLEVVKDENRMVKRKSTKRKRKIFVQKRKNAILVWMWQVRFFRIVMTCRNSCHTVNAKGYIFEYDTSFSLSFSLSLSKGLHRSIDYKYLKVVRVAFWGCWGLLRTCCKNRTFAVLQAVFVLNL